VDKIIQNIRSKVISSNLEDSLRLAKLYGNLMWNNQSESFVDLDLETILYEKLVNSGFKPKVNQVRYRSAMLHCLTEAYDSGGHTRVVERLATERHFYEHQDVLITGICSKNALQHFNARGITICTQRKSGLDAISEITELMSRYGYVLLHINPDDIISALAARFLKGSGTRIGLYNHADHCFTFGITSCDVVFEVSSLGTEIGRRYRKLVLSGFAGIPLDFPCLPPKTEELPYVLSSGSAYKYDLRSGSLFTKAVGSLLMRSQLSLVIIGIGRLPKNACKSLTRFQEEGRLKILPHVSRATYLDHLKRASCYLDSYPVCGGSAFPEAVIYEKKCVGLKCKVMGYSPADMLRVSNVELLLDKILMDDSCRDPFDRDLMWQVHAPENVLKRIVDGLVFGSLHPSPLCLSHDDYESNISSLNFTWYENNGFREPGIDDLTLQQRLDFLWLLLRLGTLFSQIRCKGLFGVIRYFLSTTWFRRWRARVSIRSIVLDWRMRLR